LLVSACTLKVFVAVSGKEPRFGRNSKASD
jgi:hypothetical protein